MWAHGWLVSRGRVELLLLWIWGDARAGGLVGMRCGAVEGSGLVKGMDGWVGVFALGEGRMG